MLSATTLTKANFVIKHADDETKKRLRSGDLSIDKSYNYYKRQEKRKELQVQVFQARNVSQSDMSKLIHGDFRDKCKEIPDDSIALVFTDPPYGKDYLYLYKDLGVSAARVLMDGGSLFTFFNQQYLREVYVSLESSGLRYNWPFAVIHTGCTTSAHPQQVRVTWKPLLWFVKGDKLRTPDYMDDSIISQPPDKTVHDCAQSPTEAEYIISKRTVEGDTVLDPCMGSATTGIAALKFNRRFIGIEKEWDRYEIGRANIAKARAQELAQKLN